MIIIGQRDKRTTYTAECLARVGKRIGGHLNGGYNEQSRDLECPDGTRAYIQWGWKLTRGLLTCMKLKRPYFILDHGYFEPRAEKISLSINGFHGKAYRQDLTGLRAPDNVPEVKPWRLDGDTIYVMGQLQNDRAVRGLDIDRWAQHIARKAHDQFDKRVVIRPHPLMINPWEPPLPPLDEVWDDAYLVITWTSSVGPQAILQGVPTVAMHGASMASPLVPATLTRKAPRDRADWARDLASREFDPRTELDRLGSFVVHCWKGAEAQAAKGQYDTEGLRV